jgi:putative phage-type endonuclease
MEQSNSFLSDLNENEYIDAIVQTHELIDEYVTENIIYMSKEEFHGQLTDAVASELLAAWNRNEDELDEICEFVLDFVDEYFDFGFIRPRSYINSSVFSSPDVESMRTKIEYLQSVDQPEQRTQEWYEFRHDVITASSIGKCLGSEAQQNSLIFEKCSPIEIRPDAVNTQSPMHWGQKYEPVSVSFYEELYSTTLGAFGCIRHPTHSFIGASPDGINVDPASDRYGRMVEIKNPFNRELNGIPKEEYWIQMQIQMETCDLDECDFLETAFKEYPGESEFFDDAVVEKKGVVLYFVQRISIGDISSLTSVTNAPRYEYMPFSVGLDKESVDAWILSKRNELRRNWSLYETQYWYLQDYSCVTVPRCKEWFFVALPKIRDTWDIIVKERETGYEHRASKKRVAKTEAIQVIQGEDLSTSHFIRNMPVVNSVCLIKLGCDE